MRHVKTHAGHIAYDIQGDGIPLVMLRGLGRTVRHWVGFDRQMAQYFRVITMDLRGIGQTTQPHRLRDTVWSYADDVVAVLNHAGIEKAHVMGVSLGGMATLAVGVRHPGRAASIVVVNTSIAGQGIPRLTIDSASFLLKNLLRRDGNLQEKLVDILVGRATGSETRKALATAYSQIAAEEGLYVTTVAKQLLAAARFAPGPWLSDMKVPTLIVAGTDDRFVPFANSQNLANLIPHAHFATIAGAGHEASADRGDELAKLLIQWIERDSSKGTAPRAS